MNAQVYNKEHIRTVVFFSRLVATIYHQQCGSSVIPEKEYYACVSLSFSRLNSLASLQYIHSDCDYRKMIASVQTRMYIYIYNICTSLQKENTYALQKITSLRSNKTERTCLTISRKSHLFLNILSIQTSSFLCTTQITRADAGSLKGSIDQMYIYIHDDTFTNYKFSRQTRFVIPIESAKYTSGDDFYGRGRACVYVKAIAVGSSKIAA